MTRTAPISSMNEGTGYMPSKEASLYASFVVNALIPRKSADPFNIATSFGDRVGSRDLGKPCSALFIATFFCTAEGKLPTFEKIGWAKRPHWKETIVNVVQ